MNKNNLQQNQPSCLAVLNRAASPETVFSRFTSHFSLKHKAAFTLAEVLITLGIIGVVAALTLPNLIANYQEKVWIKQFKTSYSILSQAYVQAYNDYGLLEDWGLDAATDKENNYKAAKILTSYIKPAQDYGQVGKRIHKNRYIDLDGRNDGGIGLNGADKNAYIFALVNGAVISITGTGHIGDYSKNMLVGVELDINGYKGPNQLGKDLFFLYLNQKNNYPEITGYPHWWVGPNNCSTKPTSGWHSGGACATWLIKRGNMDYLHRDLTSEEWSRY